MVRGTREGPTPIFLQTAVVSTEGDQNTGQVSSVIEEVLNQETACNRSWTERISTSYTVHPTPYS